MVYIILDSLIDHRLILRTYSYMKRCIHGREQKKKKIYQSISPLHSFRMYSFFLSMDNHGKFMLE
jgi:hypothetical protein